MTEGVTELDIGHLRLQWLLGSWSSLAEIRDKNWHDHAERKDLVLLAIAGCQQIGLHAEAAQLVQHALRLGCARIEIARWMLAGVRNSLGRALASAGDIAESMHAYSESIRLTPGGVESLELAKARATHQLRLMTLEHSSLNEGVWGEEVGVSETVFRKPSTGITSYAQNFEDVMLWRALGTVKEGFYIDVGAQDPIIDSVSRAFYENGWRGVHIEPTPSYAQKLRADRPDEQVIQAVLSELDGELKFYEIPQTGISTGDEEIARGHIARGFEVREITVPSLPLEEVFRRVGQREIHWLKIDVEGMEEDVLRSWGSAGNRPWIIVVESTLPLTEISSYEKWEHELLRRGYLYVYFDGLNRFYLSEDKKFIKGAFDSGPNVFDKCVLSGTASATFYRRN